MENECRGDAKPAKYNFAGFEKALLEAIERDEATLEHMQELAVQFSVKPTDPPDDISS
jgi:hypothetical protein